VSVVPVKYIFEQFFLLCDTILPIAFENIFFNHTQIFQGTFLGTSLLKGTVSRDF
jgi:hypothetical protein